MNNSSFFNESGNSSLNCDAPRTNILGKVGLQVMFAILYPLLMMIAVLGNTLVVYVVASNKEMQTVTNMFIVNLAISDLLVNFTSLWLTPVYIYLHRWIWGVPLCHLFPLFQGMATFNSTLTLMAIAVDRFFVILHPFRPRISKTVCLTIMISIWLLSLILVCPYALHMIHTLDPCGQYVCVEKWPFPGLRLIYGFAVLILQFGIPLVVIAMCYIAIWRHIVYRERVAVSSNVAAEAARRRRLLKMLISMVVIFAICWLPVNSLNIYRDLEYRGLTLAQKIFINKNFSFFFLIAHLICMSATCWNPILYAWMNENFEREFKAVLPCFPRNRGRLHHTYSVRNTVTGQENGGYSENKRDRHSFESGPTKIRRETVSDTATTQFLLSPDSIRRNDGKYMKTAENPNGGIHSDHSSKNIYHRGSHGNNIKFIYSPSKEELGVKGVDVTSKETFL